MSNTTSQLRLHRAARRGDASRVRNLLLKGVDPMVPDEGGATPLRKSGWAPTPDAAETFLDLGCDPWSDPFFVVNLIVRGHHDVVENILERYPPPVPTSEKDASIVLHRKVLIALLGKSHSLLGRWPLAPVFDLPSQREFFWKAVLSGCPVTRQTLRVLHDRLPLPDNSRLWNRLLDVACNEFKTLHLPPALLSRISFADAWKKISSSSDGMSIPRVIHALHQDNVGLSRTFLKALKKNHTPLFWRRSRFAGEKSVAYLCRQAVQMGHISLLSAAGEVGGWGFKEMAAYRYLDGSFLLHHACASPSSRKDEVAIVKRLMDAGGSLLSTDHRGQTPFHMAAQASRTSNQDTMLDFLMDSGANEHVKNKEGFSALDIMPPWLATRFSARSLARQMDTVLPVLAPGSRRSRL